MQAKMNGAISSSFAAAAVAVAAATAVTPGASSAAGAGSSSYGDRSSYPAAAAASAVTRGASSAAGAGSSSYGDRSSDGCSVTVSSAAVTRGASSAAGAGSSSYGDRSSYPAAAAAASAVTRGGSTTPLAYSAFPHSGGRGNSTLSTKRSMQTGDEGIGGNLSKRLRYNDEDESEKEEVRFVTFSQSLLSRKTMQPTDERLRKLDEENRMLKRQLAAFQSPTSGKSSKTPSAQKYSGSQSQTPRKKIRAAR
jgi:hypothetical protein